MTEILLMISVTFNVLTLRIYGKLIRELESKLKGIEIELIKQPQFNKPKRPGGED